MGARQMSARARQSSLRPEQRFSKVNPCPICLGGHDMPKKRGVRCPGFLSDAGAVAFCAREEKFGALTPIETSNGLRVAPHELDGSCPCGIPHGVAPTASTSQAEPEAEQQQLGCTVSMLAAAKKLPVKHLGLFHLYDISKYGAQQHPVAGIPYYDLNGNEARVRIRVSLDGDFRFAWKKQTPQPPLTLYAVHGLQIARGINAPYVVIAEGESDVWTLGYHGIAGVGIPGAPYWDPAWDALFAGFGYIVAVDEQDDASHQQLAKLGASMLRSRLRVASLGQWKDPSAMHCDDPARFVERWQAVIDAGLPFEEWERKQREDRRAELYEQCQDLVKAPKILDELAETAHKRGLVREDRAVKLIYLIKMSVLIADQDRLPVSGVLKGNSAAGKNRTLGRALDFVPKDSVNASTLLSDRNLFYDDEVLTGKTLVLSEATSLDSDILAYVVRSLLSEGRATLKSVKDQEKLQRDIEGPVNLLSTTILTELEKQLETRFFSIPVDESPEQTQLVMKAQGRAWSGGAIEDVDLSAWHAMYDWLRLSEKRVIIPFAEDVGGRIPPLALRLRRDWPGCLMLIATHAWLHQENRGHDEDGRIVAISEDYRVVHGLVDDLVAEGAEAKIPANVRKVVQAVVDLYNAQARGDFGGRAAINAKDVSKRVKDIDRTTVWRNLKKACDLGFLSNEEKEERMPGRYRPTGVELPADDKGILPPPRTPVSHREKSCNRATEPETAADSSHIGVAGDDAIDPHTGDADLQPPPDCSPDAERLHEPLQHLSSEEIRDEIGRLHDCTDFEVERDVNGNGHVNGRPKRTPVDLLKTDIGPAAKAALERHFGLRPKRTPVVNGKIQVAS
jgi:hypothetical protein